MASGPRWALVKDIFAAVHDAPRERRYAELERACRGDESLRREIESLLDAADDQIVPEGGIAPPLSEMPTAVRPPVVSDETGTTVGPYRLIEELGEGGFGTVFLAEQYAPVHRLVALKLIKLGMDTRQVIARFEAERQALAMMDHPSIARVLDAGTTASGRPYFVMELVRGQPITEFCDAQRLTVRERLTLFEQVCRALHHAHQKGIIHRDVKPSNVLVTLVDGDRPLSKVIDFGIAKAISARLTEKTLVTEHRGMIGTPDYMSPEQATNQLGVDTRTDVYSLGVLLYELLTGCTPFEKGMFRKASLAEVQRILRDVEPPAPSTRASRSGTDGVAAAERRSCDPKRLGSMIRGELDWIVLKAIEKNPSRRYESALALVGDVRRFLDGLPVHAAPPSKFYRAQKLLLRHKQQAALLAAVGIVHLVVAVVAVSLWRERDSYKQQVAEADAAKSNSSNEKSAATASLAMVAKERDEWRGEAGRANTRLREASERTRANDYASHLSIAAGAAERDEPRTLRDHLDAARKSGEGWEWNYLNAVADSSVQRMTGHLAPVLAMAFASDNSRLFTASADESFRAFDPETGGVAFTVQEHASEVSALATASDGRMVTVSAGRALVSDSLDGSTLKSIPAPSGVFWRAAVFTPNGDSLLLSGTDGLVRAISTATWETQWTLAAGLGTSVTALAISRDGSLLATGGFDGTSRVWDFKARTLITSFKKQFNPVRKIVFSPDSSRVMTSAQKLADRLPDDVFVWDLTGTEEIRLETATPWRSGAEFSPNGRLIAAATGSNVVLFNAGNGTEITQLRGHTSAITTLAFDPDGARIAAAGEDRSILMWNLDGTSAPGGLDGSLAEGPGSVWSPDHTRFVVASSTGEAVVVALEGLKRVLPIPAREQAAPGDDEKDSFTACFTPDGTRIVTSWRDSGAGTIWDAETGSRITDLMPYSKFKDFDAPSREHSLVSTSADGLYAAALTNGGRVQIFDRGSGIQLGVLDSAGARFTEFSPDAKHLLVGTNDGAAIYELGTRKRTVTLSVGTVGADAVGVRTGVYSPGGARLVTLSDQGAVQVWTAAGEAIAGPVNSKVRASGVRDRREPTPEESKPIEGESAAAIEHATFSADGSHLLVPVPDGQWEVWRVGPGGCAVACTLSGRAREIRAAVFSPDSSRVVLAGAHGFLAIFDTTYGNELLILPGHSGTVTGVTFSPDGLRLLSSTRSETRIWDSRGASARHAEEERVKAAHDQNLQDANNNNQKWADRVKGKGFESVNGVRGSIASDRSLTSLRRWDAHAQVTAATTLDRDEIAALVDEVDAAPTRNQADPRSAQIIEKLRAALQKSPKSMPLLQAFPLMLYKQGEFRLVIERFEDAERRDKGSKNGDDALPPRGNPSILACVVMSHARLGHREQAVNLLEDLRKLVREEHAGHALCRRRLCQAEAAVEQELARPTAEAPSKEPPK